MLVANTDDQAQVRLPCIDVNDRHRACRGTAGISRLVDAGPCSRTIVWRNIRLEGTWPVASNP